MNTRNWSEVQTITKAIRALEKAAEKLPEPALSEVVTAIKSLNYAREHLKGGWR